MDFLTVGLPLPVRVQDLMQQDGGPLANDETFTMEIVRPFKPTLAKRVRMNMTLREFVEEGLRPSQGEESLLRYDDQILLERPRYAVSFELEPSSAQRSQTQRFKSDYEYLGFRMDMDAMFAEFPEFFVPGRALRAIVSRGDGLSKLSFLQSEEWKEIKEDVLNTDDVEEVVEDDALLNDLDWSRDANLVLYRDLADKLRLMDRGALTSFVELAKARTNQRDMLSGRTYTPQQIRELDEQLKRRKNLLDVISANRPTTYQAPDAGADATGAVANVVELSPQQQEAIRQQQQAMQQQMAQQQQAVQQNPPVLTEEQQRRELANRLFSSYYDTKEAENMLLEVSGRFGIGNNQLRVNDLLKNRITPDVVGRLYRGKRWTPLTKALDKKRWMNVNDILYYSPNPELHYGTERPLLTAVKNNILIVDMLLLGGADPNLANQDGNTALHLATLLANEGCMEDLIKWGANINSTNTRGVTPLMVAAKNDNLRAINLLLYAGANWTLADIDGRKAIDYVSLPESNATRRNLRIAVFERWESMTIEEREVKKREGRQSLFPIADVDDEADALAKMEQAIVNDNYREVLKILNAGVTANSRFLSGEHENMPLLHLACKLKRRRCVGALLARGANVNTVYDGMTPLNLAVDAKSVTIVRRLVISGASLDTPRLPPINRALQNRNFRMVKVLLKAGANPNFRGETAEPPLHVAMEMSEGRTRDDMIKLLLHSGANANAVDITGRRADYLGESSIFEEWRAKSYNEKRRIVREFKRDHLYIFE